MSATPSPHRALPAWLTGRWLAGHVVVLAIATLFLRLGWWQMVSALRGHVISIGYALQWPVFAGFGVFLWIRTVRLHARNRRAVPPRPTAAGPLTWTFHRDADPAAERSTDGTETIDHP